MRCRIHPTGTVSGGWVAGRIFRKCGDLPLESPPFLRVSSNDPGRLDVYQQLVLAITNIPRRVSSNDPGQLGLYHSLVLAITNIRLLSEVERIHGRIITSNFMSKSVLVCRLIHRYFSFGRIKDAEKLFDQLPKRSIYCFNYMIKGYINEKAYTECLRVWARGISEEMIPDPHTLSLILMVCVGLKELKQGELIHGHVVQRGLLSNCFLMTNLVDLYSKCSRVGEARILFDEMLERDVFTWTVMIDGYLRVRNYDEALYCFSGMEDAGIQATLVTWNALIGGCVRQGLVLEAVLHFRRMQEVGIMPDKVSMCLILSGCAHSALLNFGRESHAFVLRKGFKTDQFLVSALVDMYAKCGCLKTASYLFNQSEVRDVGMWNAMLAGYEIHGKCKEALEIFSQMQESKVRPNQVTLSSLLSACSHAGMVNEGHECFNAMIHYYKIIPHAKHCAFVVDMFGRVGSLEEACKFIESMPIEPSKDVWAILLNAFRVHHNAELAEVAAHQLFSCEGVEDDGYHIAISHIYTETGEWEEMSKVQRQRDERLKKRTGLSWIQVEKHIHVFYSGDTTHPQSDQIYSALRVLEAAYSLLSI